MMLASHSLSGLFADRYMIERAVGEGASATVYLAHDQKQDRQIALKVLDRELSNAIGAQRFLQEIRITSRLQHPHILPIHDSGEWEGLLYYVLPFVSGESLRARLDREKQLPIEECVQLTCDVASALAHSHSKGVIHRDVKPENILLSDGHALIADFGIARTIESTSAERLTSSGLIVGTSQYMSPEQASGEREIDARSDIYSLGCVLYEMLAGVEPFNGPTVQAIIAQRFTHAPRPVTTYRPTVPEHLVHVLDRALAISPADRFQTMKEFESELPRSSTGERRRPGRAIRDTLQTGRGRLGLAAAVVASVAILLAVVPGSRAISSFFTSSPKLDTALYVVLPPVTPSGSATATTTEVGDLLHEALSRWTGIDIVKQVTVQNALRKSTFPRDIDEAKKIAARLGAGKLIWGRVDSDTKPNARYQFSLVDLTTERVREISVAGDSAKLGSTVAFALLRDPKWPPDAALAETHTRSYPALQAYGKGHAALKTWDLGSAHKLFATAVQLDPEFVDARFWSAQLGSWTKSNGWFRDAVYAASKSASLPLRESALARALGAMAGANYPDACKEYRALIAADSMDYMAWHGLGECLRKDEAVTRSSNSPSRYMFRASFRGAAMALTRAVQLEPGAHAIVAFTTIQRLLATSPTSVRRGADATGAYTFAAYPSLSADTLSYIPYPLKEFTALPLSAIRGRDEALDRNARELEQFANAWIAAAPGNPDAYEALATVLEGQGNIAPRIPGRQSASEALARALALTSDPVQRTRLAASEVRLRIKRGEFREANRLADSMLSKAAARDSDELIAISGYVGRTRAFSRFAQGYEGWLPKAVSQFNVPDELNMNASELFARAALGECGGNITTIEGQLTRNIENYITPEKRDALRHILTARSYSLLVPCTNGQSALLIAKVEGRLARAQQAFAKKEFRATRSILDSLMAGRGKTRPGDLSLDFYFQEAWLRAKIGDTLGAVKQLDRALGALGAMSAGALKEPGSAAALGRVMILRAQLAVGARDAAAASQWTAAVDQLYSGADAPLRNSVDTLKVLVRTAQKH